MLRRAVWWGHAQQQPVIDMIRVSMKSPASRPGTGSRRPDPALIAKIAEIAGPGF